MRQVIKERQLRPDSQPGILTLFGKLTGNAWGSIAVRRAELPTLSCPRLLEVLWGAVDEQPIPGGDRYIDSVETCLIALIALFRPSLKGVSRVTS